LTKFSNLAIIYLLAYEDGTDSVPKRRHIKFRRRGITQKKTYKNKKKDVIQISPLTEILREDGRGAQSTPLYTVKCVTADYSLTEWRRIMPV
jgi:hypothetical protein